MTSASYELSGNREITLPEYMKILQPRKESEAELYGPVIACGIQPQTTNMIMLTSDGSFYEIDVTKFFNQQIKINQVYPIKKGRLLEFLKKDMIITVESDEILKASQKIELMNLEIGMNDENKINNIT